MMRGATHSPFAAHLRALAVVASLLVCPLGAQQAQPREALSVDGERFPAHLVAVDPDWTITLEAAGKTRRLPAAELVAWGAPAEVRRAPQVLLSDGGLLVADLLACDQQRLEVAAGEGGDLALPLEHVAGVVLAQPADPVQQAALWFRLWPGESLHRPSGDRPASQPAPANNDRLLLANGDELVGTISKISAKGVAIAGEVGPVDVEASRIAAVAFNPSLLAAPATERLRCLVGLADGSRLFATSLSLSDQEARLRLAGGMEITFAAAEVIFLQVFGGKAVYLSDLEVETYRHLPFLELAWPYATDANVEGGPLRAGGRLYCKGIGLHSASRLTWRLDQAAPAGRDFQQFEADLAIDDSTNGQGSVVVRVFIDGEQRYQSDIVRGGMPPVPISVDVRGGARLSVVVDYADHAEVLDHADVLNARLE